MLNLQNNWFIIRVFSKITLKLSAKIMIIEEKSISLHRYLGLFSKKQVSW
jgi:hypothetical protein